MNKNDKTYVPKSERVNSPFQKKQKHDELLQTYKHGLNWEFKVLKKIQSQFFRTQKDNLQFSDRKITKIAKREDFLSDQEIMKINKVSLLL